MEIPKIGDGKYIILIADARTGNILNNDGSYYLNQGSDFFTVFNSKEEAYTVGNMKIKENSKIEVLIYDGNGDFLDIIR